MSSSRRRPISPIWDGHVDNQKDRSNSRGTSDFSRSLRGLVDKFSGAQPDPSDPVVNGASAADKPWLRGLIADLASQIPRGAADVHLIASIADTKIFDGGLVDDKTYQMEKIIQLAASLPTDSKAQEEISTGLIKALWNNLQHPPLSLQGPEYRFRTADGSNNNLMYPDLGKAGSSYARTVTPRTLKPGDLPDPGLVFDVLYARGDRPREHPNKISSMLLYLATIIIHDVFHTDTRDPSRLKTSSYLDLAPLYGNSTEEQAKVRAFKDGLLKLDTFSESRILGFPPGVSALLVCFNRYHNFVAIQLKDINEDGRFTVPKNGDEERIKQLDEELFQTARLVTCGLYVNIVLNDYVRTILNLNRVDSPWTLDPRDNADFFDSLGVPQAIGNQVSCEFNLVYRWHSATSIKDEQWTKDAYSKLFPNRDISSITEDEFLYGVRKWLQGQHSDPSQWTLDFGRYNRNERGAFKDQDLVQILTEATEDVICAFGPRQVPVAMKLIEVLGMKQARSWHVATLNEFRKYFSLEPHKEFSDISSDPEIQGALRALYQHPDYVELYPGLVVEDAKASMTPGSGICLPFTASRTILADAVALVRGDRFYTVDYSPVSLTNWGFNSIKSDSEVAQGHCMYNLIMRALPNYYRGNSIYAMYPFVVPTENYYILKNLGVEQDFNYDRPSLEPVPRSIKSWQAVVHVLGDANTFKVPWGEHIKFLTGHDYMLGNDTPKAIIDHKNVYNAIYVPVNGMEQIRRFYEALTRQLIVIGQEKLRNDWYQLDICGDVAQPAHSVFVAKLWHIPLKAKGDHSLGVEVDKLYLAMALMFAYVFLDGDTTRSFRLRKAAKQAADLLTKLSKVVCEAVRTGERLNVSRLFHMGEEGRMLESYGRKLIDRMFDIGWDLDTVVANLIPTAAAADGLQAQHMTQMIDLYLSEDYRHHWPDIVKLAQSDDPAAFETLKSYALEANRLAPASYGLMRKAAENVRIQDRGKDVDIKAGETIYLDFIAAGTDEKVFPEPYKIKLDRPRTAYIHHGWGMHACIGREITQTAMAAQLKVFAQLKNLRRAPGPQGEMKFTYLKPNPVSSDPVPAPGLIKLFLKEDWGDFWPFPTTLKVHHDGFFPVNEATLTRDLFVATGLPDAQVQVVASSRANSRSPSANRDRSRDRSRSGSRSRSRSRSRERSRSHKSQGRSASRRDDRDGCPVGAKGPRRMSTLENALAYGDEGGYQGDENGIDMTGVINSGQRPRIAVNGEDVSPQSPATPHTDGH